MYSDLIIVLGKSEQENFHRPEISLKKKREIDNEATISKKAKMKRNFNRNQKRITLWDLQLSSLTYLGKQIIKIIFSEFPDTLNWWVVVLKEELRLWSIASSVVNLNKQVLQIIFSETQKQPPRGLYKKKCSENMQQI